MLPKILLLPPNRVRRNYKGGLLLEKFAGVKDPQDGNQPEDWIASTVGARNPGLEEVSSEGLAYIYDSSHRKIFIKDLFAQNPDYFLGKKHVSLLGTELGFLAKLLDSSMRLHLQAHPTAAYAQKHLNSRWGKLETYYILGIRPGYEGYIWLGFQHSPGYEEWTRIVLEQDKVAMQACFEKIPVQVGEVWVIPGGLPHAIGEGLLVLEVMEPTDWVVRCEFEREGIIVPPPARFMGMEPVESLKIFDLTEYTIAQIRDKCGVPYKRLIDEPNKKVDLLIGAQQTECFVIRRVTTSTGCLYEKEEVVHLGIVVSGKGVIQAGEEFINVKEGSTFLVPANVRELQFKSTEGKLEVIFCTPGYGIERL